MSRSYSKKKNSNNKYKSLRRTRKVNYKRSKKRSIKRNMSKKTQKGSGIWKRIKSMFSKKKYTRLNNNKQEKLEEKLEEIGTKADKLLNELKLNRDRSVRGIDTNISILEGIVEICEEKDKDITKLKELGEDLIKIVSRNPNNKLVQWNKDINEIKELIKKL